MNIRMILPIEDLVEVEIVLLNDVDDDVNVELQVVIVVVLRGIVRIFDEAN
jgi:hypothetical protein